MDQKTRQDQKAMYMNRAILASRGLIARKNIDVKLYMDYLRASGGYLSLLKTLPERKRELRIVDGDTRQADLELHMSLFFAGVLYGRGEERNLKKANWQQAPPKYRGSKNVIAGRES